MTTKKRYQMEEDPALVDGTQHAFQQLRGEILNGHLAAGEILSQVKLAERLNVSRGPLREALRMLQREGLIQSEFNRRVRIAPIELDDLEQLYVSRLAIEPLAVMLTVPHMTNAQLADLELILDRLHPNSELNEDEITKLHRSFHFGFTTKAGSRVSEQCHQLWEYTERYRRLYQSTAEDRPAMLKQAHEDHHALLEAARRRDGIEAANITAVHLSRTALATIARIDRTHSPEMIYEALRYATGGAELRMALPRI